MDNDDGKDSVRLGEIDSMWSFIKHIDWTEPWLLSLVAFHLFCLIITIITRKYNNFQIILFLIMLLMIYLSEYLNEYAAKHYRMFSRLQYFDSSGLFISVVYNIPLLINCLVMICIWLHTAAHMIVTVKRGQLKERLQAPIEGTSETAGTLPEKNDESKKKD
ncbi:transmembrane protein 18-like [Diadema antillarum]|uniref:transmembrane protein 18-like n=1 Tax=Diadema antillarum TaxID=105358 RepID=UPI003A8C6CFB